jgi:hypothetical protein
MFWVATASVSSIPIVASAATSLVHLSPVSGTDTQVYFAVASRFLEHGEPDKTVNTVIASIPAGLPNCLGKFHG